MYIHTQNFGVHSKIRSYMVRTRSASRPVGQKPGKKARRRNVAIVPNSKEPSSRPVGTLVLDLGRDLEEAIFLRRPSRRNRCVNKLVGGGNEFN